MAQTQNITNNASVTFPYVYNFPMGPATGITAPFTDPGLTAIIQKAEASYNAYYHSPAYTGNKPKHITVTIHSDLLEFELHSSVALDDGREGQALRQFSCYLLEFGIQSYLNESDPQKILRRV